MGPGTLYGSIDRMMRDGLVEESDKQDNERRRYYRLTRLGRSVLAAELERLDAAVSSARALGLIGSSKALPALQRAAQADSDRDVRHSAQFAAEVVQTRN